MKYVNTSPEETIDKWIQKKNPRRLLDLSFWLVNELPAIPDEVEYLTVSNSTVKEILVLPKNLKWLNCSETNIYTLPYPLPVNLQFLDCRLCINLEPFDIPKHIRTKTHFVQILDERLRKAGNVSYFIEKWIRDGKHNQELDLSSLNLTELPSLPDTVRNLNVRNNPIRSLPNLPCNLKKLNCSGTFIERFENMPSSLRYINCEESEIQSLNGLPNSVRYIYASYCFNLQIVDKLPSELRRIEIYDSHVEILANIPNKVEFMDIGDNRIETIPFLPESLKVLRCILTYRLSYITNLPSKLEVLELGTGKLSSLPLLPETLRCLHVSFISILNGNVLPNSIEEFDSIELSLQSNSFDIRQYLH